MNDVVSNIKEQCEAILSELDKLGGENHNKSASRRTRDRLNTLKKNVTQMKQDLLALDRKQ
jgi:BMFP domain-containing protein YqiC